MQTPGHEDLKSLNKLKSNIGSPQSNDPFIKDFGDHAITERSDERSQNNVSNLQSPKEAAKPNIPKGRPNFTKKSTKETSETKEVKP